ncbi:unnamed protein product [Caenorhabditis auriculariae]|uniref:Major facilitator superfamily (MFS) profile domain-containing protein n=1 Tax=Caenorhabditis auriculariae TaxID=2777116 RepID=A0A8S1GXX5_9PELO|nr:unnamed protein product [Caenorhabditis auriculariae]
MAAPTRTAIRGREGRRPMVPRRAMFAEEENKPSEWRHSWLIVFGFYILLTETGVRQVMNGFVVPVMETYNCTKREADTAVLMIPMSSSLIFGPLCSMFYAYAGAQISIGLGAIFCILGFVCGAFAPTIEILMVCTLAIGVGCGLMRNSTISIQCEYFKKKRNFAMSCISIGPGIGIFALPRILKKIMDVSNGWTEAWIFLASLYVISGVMALFITKKPGEGQRNFFHFSGVKVFTKLEFILHLIASFCASAVTFIYKTLKMSTATRD